MLRVNQVKTGTGASEAEIKERAARILRVPAQDILRMEIVRRSVDARRKPEIFYSYTLDLAVKDENKVLRRFKGRENLVCRPERQEYRFPAPGEEPRTAPTVIVGTGPAGLFCGYFLALHGYRPILLERGRCVEERTRDVEAFWQTGKLDPSSNVQFGEGGAGTFSDGKLNTLVKDKDGRNRAVLDVFVRFGAGEEILYDAKPHIGTDILCTIVKRMREEIIRLGGEVRFEARVTDLCIDDGRVTGVVTDGGERLACSQLVLAIGHSARDTFSMLHEKQIPMKAKDFAVGLRVEHLQSVINKSQYGMEEAGELGAAPYKAAAKAKDGRGVYTFCMCPGGYVVNASSEEGRTAVNGMSYSKRDGSNANSAVIVTVTEKDFGSGHPLAGIAFQRRLEERAFAVGGGKIPVQRYGDFKRCVERGEEARGGWMNESKNIRSNSAGEAGLSEDMGIGQDCADRESGGHREKQGNTVEPQCRGGFVWADVSRILPEECNRAIVEGMEVFGRQIQGFDSPDACLSGVESRTSSPVRILRNEDMQSELKGLYPCGEGAGYAGGIVSAAMDGIRVAEAIAKRYAP